MGCGIFIKGFKIKLSYGLHSSVFPADVFDNFEDLLILYAILAIEKNVRIITKEQFSKKRHCPSLPPINYL